MKRKRKPTAHQKQMRFFTVFFGAMLVLLVIAVLWLINLAPFHGR